MVELKYFSKRRIANIISAVVILWVLFLWSHVIFAIIDGTFTDITHKELLLAMIGLLNGIAGWCAKHLWDTCGEPPD